jgi:hypothetical protein
LITFNSWPWERTARGGSGAGEVTAVGLGLGNRVGVDVVGAVVVLLLGDELGVEVEWEPGVAPVPQAVRNNEKRVVAVNPARRIWVRLGISLSVTPFLPNSYTEALVRPPMKP